MLNATINNGSVAQLNRALDYGSRGYRFESCRNHKRNTHLECSFFLCFTVYDAYKQVVKGHKPRFCRRPVIIHRCDILLRLCAPPHR